MYVYTIYMYMYMYIYMVPDIRLFFHLNPMAHEISLFDGRKNMKYA